VSNDVDLTLDELYAVYEEYQAAPTNDVEEMLGKKLLANFGTLLKATENMLRVVVGMKTTCVYCGEQQRTLNDVMSEDESKEDVRTAITQKFLAHARVCTEHPMHGLLLAAGAAREALETARDEDRTRDGVVAHQATAALDVLVPAIAKAKGGAS
jgi:hypothetical protein